ncbi:MAG: hypothetical protein L3K19_01375 [Thermoplasmata archaeon]|nr:hypothetical protein [Thermoplasmata archaeon]
MRNDAALRRARRLFTLYGGALAAIFGITLGLSYTGPVPVAEANPLVPLGLSLLTLALAAAGLWLTFGRTPSAVRIADDELWVRERGGRVRRFPAPPATRLWVEEQYPAGPLTPAPTELVRLTPPDGRARHYVFESGLLYGPFSPPLGRGRS